MKLKMIKEVILQVLFPRTCVVCDKVLDLPKDWHKLITEDVKADIKEIRKIFICEKCAALPGVCHGKVELKKDVEGLALMSHDDSARKIIYGLKFHDLRINAQFIGFEMAARLGRRIPENAHLIPVPLHKNKLRQRGFNQAELIADSFAYWHKRLHGKQLTVDKDLLERAEDTPALKELGAKERKRMIDGAFRADKDAVWPQNIILIDDIYTSGTTINECAKTIKKAASANISFVCASAVT